ncbi:MAG: galactoside O-acetyltransferase [Clostridiales bacterium]|nr:MAG: galactoside O-acetyltransferase [Clostridiales bacterium]
MTSFYTPSELAEIGFKRYGTNVLVSRKASIYGAENITIGDNVRIDDFCILSGHVEIGSNIHISAYNALYGTLGIVLEDYTGISPRCSLFSAMDDFSGEFLIGPIHREELTNVIGGKITLKRFSQLGCNCVVFPEITIGEGAIVGAMSMVKNDMTPWSINYGIPAKKVGERNKGLLKKLHHNL